MFEGLKDEMRRPATAIAVVIGAVGIIVGVVTSVYFYYLSVREGKVSYQTDQVQVFNQSPLGEKPVVSAHPLYVVDERGNKIKTIFTLRGSKYGIPETMK